MIDYLIIAVIWFAVTLIGLWLTRLNKKPRTVQWWARAVLATPVWPLALAYSLFKLSVFVWEKARIVEMLER